MDSFLEEPRTMPKPAPIIQEVGALSVPEVSLMFQNARQDKTPLKFKYGKEMQSYNAWKLRTSPNSTEFDSFAISNTNNKENINIQDILLSKKQVRFESPTQKPVTTIIPHTTPIVRKTGTTRDYFLQKSIDTSSFTTKNDTITSKPISELMSPLKDSTSRIPSSNPNVYRPFEKLYVSNIPNTKLDLSFLEPPKNPKSAPKIQSMLNHSNTSTNTNTKASDVHFNTSVNDGCCNRIKLNDTNLINVMECNPTNNTTKPLELNSTNTNALTYSNANNSQNMNSYNHNEINTVKASNNNETSSENGCLSELNITNDNKNSTNESASLINDLLTIIKLQNKQLQLLQNQVDKLIQLNESYEKNEKPKPEKKQILQKDQCVGTNFCNINDNELSFSEESSQSDQNKISVGLMTSFEVSFKPPAAKKVKPKNLIPMDCITSNDVSFHESVKAVHKNSKSKRSDYQTVENILPRNWSTSKNNETEYTLGSHEFLDVKEPPQSPESSIHIDMEEYDTDSDGECSSLDAGWTFYNDILGQVNNILENTSPTTCKRENCFQTKKAQTENKITDTTLQKIKQATLQRLQSENILRARSTKNNNGDEQCVLKPNDISFAVKQILMKYMPDESVVNVVTRNEQEYVNSDKCMQNDTPLATFKYMQQCNVVTNANQYYGKPPNQTKPKRFMNKHKTIPNSTDPKILDITTLKQQPKLL